MVKVLLFAGAREAAGQRTRLSVDLPPGCSLQDLLEEVGRSVPPLARLLPHCRVAVDGTYASRPYRSYQLTGREEVALLPPYSGG